METVHLFRYISDSIRYSASEFGRYSSNLDTEHLETAFKAFLKQFWRINKTKIFDFLGGMTNFNGRDPDLVKCFAIDCFLSLLACGS